MDEQTVPTIPSELLHELIKINTELNVTARFGNADAVSASQQWAAMNMAALNQRYGAQTVRCAIEAVPTFDGEGL